MRPDSGPDPGRGRTQIQPLYPLQTGGRFRNAGVERQIRELLSCGHAERLRRAGLTDIDVIEFVAEEALIYLVRHLMRANEPDAAMDLMECLFKRCYNRILRKVWALLPACSRDDREDCARSVLVEMTSLVQVTDAGKEFWEVNFTTCLERLCSN